VSAGSRAVLARDIVSTLRLVLGLHEVMGMPILLDVYFIWQRLVETNRPKRLTISLDLTSMS